VNYLLGSAWARVRIGNRDRPREPGRKQVLGASWGWIHRVLCHSLIEDTATVAVVAVRDISGGEGAMACLCRDQTLVPCSINRQALSSRPSS